jgi:acetyl-CoA carboxylase biotin carboxyl carrier protein
MAENKGDQNRSASMKVDTGLVRELAELLNETGLTEIEVEDGDRKIRVSRTAMAAALQAPVAASPQPAPQGSAAADGSAPVALAAAERVDAVRSPMVGTVYLSADPGSDPFVRRGDRVKAGDTLLIVEAMKVMNPITAPSDGTVQDILVENAQPVEFDQPLIVLG